MRIADKMAYGQVKSNLSRNRSDLAELQVQASTHKRVNRPSDDPLATTRVLAQRSEIQGNDQYLRNINSARSFLEFGDQSLGELTEVLQRAKELAISQANDPSTNDVSRRVVAAEIEQLFQQSVQIGNRKLADRFLFGGYKTTKAPFEDDGTYRGDDGEILIQVNKEAFLASNIPGSKVFLGEGLSPDGVVRPSMTQPRTSEELAQRNEQARQQEEQQKANAEVSLRGPASQGDASFQGADSSVGQDGKNIFRVLKALEIGLKTNDKSTVQDSLDDIDAALAQVILARSQLGARVMVLNSSMESLQRTNIDSKSVASQLEDADIFSTVSDINKTENSLKATLATSGKLIQPSLLDFLR